MKVRAYCPGHISTIFRVCMHDDPIDSGSRGAGIVIDEGVVTEVESVSGSGVGVSVNGVEMDFLLSRAVVGKMMPRLNERLIISHTTKLPVGAGFGVSGACALGVGLCLDEMYSLGLGLDEVGAVAHVAEVECGTGLGDVGPMLVGGVELRKSEGAPGRSVVENIQTNMDGIVCFSFGSFDTGSVVGGDDAGVLNALSDRVLAKLFSLPSFDNFMKCSIEFAESAGFLTPRLRDVISRLNAIDGCYASQTMLGESGFVIFRGDMNKKIHDILKNIGCVFQTRICCSPARLI